MKCHVSGEVTGAQDTQAVKSQKRPGGRSRDIFHLFLFNIYWMVEWSVTSVMTCRSTGRFNVSMLKNILKNYEIPFTAKDRKKDLVQHLAIFVKKCSCFL